MAKAEAGEHCDLQDDDDGLFSAAGHPSANRHDDMRTDHKRPFVFD
jgi:hypothetical protein